MDVTDFHAQRKLQFLIALSLQGKVADTFTGFECRLGFPDPQPDLRKVLKILVSRQVLTPTSTNKFFELHPKRLRDFIDDLPVTELFFDYFSKYHLVSW